MESVKGIYRHGDQDNLRWEARFKIGIDESTGRAKYRSVYAKTRDEAIAKRDAIIGAKSEKVKQNQSMELNLLILGAGTHGKDVYEIAKALHVFKKISFLDDNAIGDNIIGKCSEVYKFRDTYSCAVVAIGTNQVRRKLAELLIRYNFMLPSIVSPDANISLQADIGNGVVILPMARVGDASIGDFGIVASNGVVNSGATLGRYCHVDCGAIVKKEMDVKDGIWIRSGEIYG